MGLEIYDNKSLTYETTQNCAAGMALSSSAPYLRRSFDELQRKTPTEVSVLL
jgi:hypothetical protein